MIWKIKEDNLFRDEMLSKINFSNIEKLELEKKIKNSPPKLLRIKRRLIKY